MKLHHLPKINAKPKKRLGRGHGSGKVKTSGRGTKGQRARGKIKAGFEGGQLPLIKRLPLLRGKKRNKRRSVRTFALPIKRLANLPAGTTVSLETLQKYHMIGNDVSRVKILGNDVIAVALTVAVPCTKGARASIEKAGGTVTY